MSGGVDSSVAAFLLKEKGYDVTGVFIHGYNVDGCAEKDAEDARLVAEHIGIPFYAIDAKEEYFKRVVQYMIREYSRGRTPNPDVMCNKEIKFGLFLEKAKKLGATKIATGHYARIESNPVGIFEAKDKTKDQTYFLWTLGNKEIESSLFPIGEYTKKEIREIAKKAGLHNAEKKDSQGICFLGKVRLPDFLKRFIEPRKGDILDIQGNKIGEHNGIQFYTIGQRHLGISVARDTDSDPYYIVEKNSENNTLVVTEGNNHPRCFRKKIELENINTLQKQGSGSFKVLARARYRQSLVPAELILNEREKSGFLVFEEPQKFIASGQSAVWYSPPEHSGGHELWGGGIIKS